MRPFLLGLAVLVFQSTFLANGQANYVEFGPANRLDAYYDDFSTNNKGNYIGDTDNARYSLNGGVYRLENKTDETWVKFLTSDPKCTSPSIVIDESRDYEVELSVRFISGKDNRDISLTWGANREDCSSIVGDRNLGISGNGFYMVYEYDLQGKYIETVPWVESSIVKKGGFNKLTVRRAGSKIYMFINENLVYSMPTVSLNGQFFGVSYPAKTIIEVDDFRVSYLYSKSSSVTYSQPDEVFYDDFQNNTKGHYEGSTDNSSLKVSSGTYRFENKTDGFWTKLMLLDSECSVSPYLDLDENRDFEIEFSIRFVKGADNKDISLRWGASFVDCNSIENHMNFGFSANGYSIVYEYDAAGTYVEHLPWTTTGLVNKSGYNKLTVRKKGGFDQLLLNGQLVHTMAHRPFHGNYHGVSLPEKTTVEIDYIKVSYLGGTVVANTQAQVGDEVPPEIILVSPVTSKNATITVFQGQLMVSGYAKDDSGIKAVAINAKAVTHNKQGYFETVLDLAPGSNFVTLKAEDAEGNVTAMAFNCERQEGRSMGTVEEEQTRTNPNRRVISSNYLKGKRVALVIGNKSYTHVSPLTNSVNDAMDMAATLKTRGFDVITLYDAKTKAEIRNAIIKFTQAVRGDPEAVSLFYYSGHGMQIDGVNYLVPTEANMEIKADADDQCMNMDFVMRAMDETNNPLKIVILDACRNNPFRSFTRSGEQGLVSVNAPKGTYIVFATKPGSVASDGTGSRNGLFTSKLLSYINEENLTLEEVFKKVAGDVAKDSEDRQRPWISSDFTGEFYFNLKN